MAKQKSTNDTRDDLLPGEEALARSYRRAAREAPPAALDAKILAHARQAVEPAPARSALARRWAVPVSVAALVVLSLTVVLQFTPQDPLDYYDAAPRVEAPAPARETAEAPAKPKSAAPDAGIAAAPSSEAPATVRERDAPRAAAPMARSESPMSPSASVQTAQKMALATSDSADVVSVRIGGRPGAYEFSVMVRSPDTGCAHYANWWEVLSNDGKLLYRRVLAHSHAGEQPFTRSGGPIPIQADTVVWIRAHMNTGGYGGAALRGSVAEGFHPAQPAPGFAAALATQQPLPTGCDF
jgi:hypothetical protein